MSKICIICSEDCSNAPRFKTDDGHYVCARCHAIQQDNDQEQVDEIEAPTPKWADIHDGFAAWFFFVPLAALICATVFAPKSLFPHENSGYCYAIAILYTWLCLIMAGRDQRFLSYLVKVITGVPGLIVAALTDSRMVMMSGVIWSGIMFFYTTHDFTKDRDDDDRG